eukprot:1245969-Pyramimonas_sp.AAC.1
MASPTERASGLAATNSTTNCTCAPGQAGLAPWAATFTLLVRSRHHSTGPPRGASAGGPRAGGALPAPSSPRAWAAAAAASAANCCTYCTACGRGRPVSSIRSAASLNPPVSHWRVSRSQAAVSAAAPLSLVATS